MTELNLHKQFKYIFQTRQQIKKVMRIALIPRLDQKTKEEKTRNQPKVVPRYLNSNIFILESKCLVVHVLGQNLCLG